VSSADAINGIADTIIARITANFTPLGLTTITETDQEPQYIDPGTAYIIPFVEGKDTIKIFNGGEQHNYPINLVGFYKYPDIPTGLRPVRSYGLTALDLFTRKNATLTYTVNKTTYGSEVVGATLEVGYWRNGDFIMHVWTLQLQMQQVI